MCECCGTVVCGWDDDWEDSLPHCGTYNCWCDGSCFPEWDEEERDDDEED